MDDSNTGEIFRYRYITNLERGLNLKLWFGEELEEGMQGKNPEKIREISRNLRKRASERGIPRKKYVEKVHEEKVEKTRQKIEDLERSDQNILLKKLKLAEEMEKSVKKLRELFKEIPQNQRENSLKKALNDLEEKKETVWKDVENLAEKIAPNASFIVGKRLTARLIGLAGGIKELARLPSSTIQVLGAEGALFKHLNTGSDPPKHGLIYQHPDIKSFENFKGRLARSLASIIAISIRIDVYSGKDKTEKLQKKWEKRLKQVKKEK